MALRSRQVAPNEGHDGIFLSPGAYTVAPDIPDGVKLKLELNDRNGINILLGSKYYFRTTSMDGIEAFKRVAPNVYILYAIKAARAPSVIVLFWDIEQKLLCSDVFIVGGESINRKQTFLSYPTSVIGVTVSVKVNGFSKKETKYVVIDLSMGFQTEDIPVSSRLLFDRVMSTEMTQNVVPDDIVPKLPLVRKLSLSEERVPYYTPPTKENILTSRIITTLTDLINSSIPDVEAVDVLVKASNDLIHSIQIFYLDLTLSTEYKQSAFQAFRVTVSLHKDLIVEYNETGRHLTLSVKEYDWFMKKCAPEDADYGEFEIVTEFGTVYTISPLRTKIIDGWVHFE